jgi:hypothetical protein
MPEYTANSPHREGGAHVDAADVAVDPGERNPVAPLDRPLGQQDQAEDEVLHHRLQTEADAHRERARDPRDALQPDARRRRAHADVEKGP